MLPRNHHVILTRLSLHYQIDMEKVNKMRNAEDPPSIYTHGLRINFSLSGAPYFFNWHVSIYSELCRYIV